MFNYHGRNYLACRVIQYSIYKVRKFVFNKHENDNDFPLPPLSAAKLQHVGRAGVPGSTRYAAHEHGLTTEDMTQHVIANYALIDEYNKSQQGEWCRVGSKGILTSITSLNKVRMPGGD